MSFSKPNHRLRLTAVLLSAALAGCAGGDMDDLRAFVEQEKSKQRGTVAPLPEIKPYETFLYQASNERSPFQPPVFVQPTTAPGAGISPNTNRPREALESYPLDSLRMVGTLERDGVVAALIKAQDGTIHRVKSGNYLGQNYGKITAISEEKVELTEIVPDGQGGWLERQASVALSE